MKNTFSVQGRWRRKKLPEPRNFKATPIFSGTDQPNLRFFGNLVFNFFFYLGPSVWTDVPLLVFHPTVGYTALRRVARLHSKHFCLCFVRCDHCVAFFPPPSLLLPCGGGRRRRCRRWRCRRRCCRCRWCYQSVASQLVAGSPWKKDKIKPGRRRKVPIKIKISFGSKLRLVQILFSFFLVSKFCSVFYVRQSDN